MSSGGLAQKIVEEPASPPWSSPGSRYHWLWLLARDSGAVFGGLIVVAVVIVLTGSTWEQAMWIVVRAVTVGWVLFSVARLFDPRKLLAWLQRKGHWGPAMALSRALHSQPEKTDDSSGEKPGA